MGIAVIAAELLDEKTMSEAFRAASRHPVGRPVLVSAALILNAHLFGVIPQEYDPLHLFWLTVRSRRCPRTSGAHRSSLS